MCAPPPSDAALNVRCSQPDGAHCMAYSFAAARPIGFYAGHTLCRQAVRVDDAADRTADDSSTRHPPSLPATSSHGSWQPCGESPVACHVYSRSDAALTHVCPDPWGLARLFGPLARGRSPHPARSAANRSSRLRLGGQARPDECAPSPRWPANHVNATTKSSHCRSPFLVGAIQIKVDACFQDKQDTWSRRPDWQHMDAHSSVLAVLVARAVQ